VTNRTALVASILVLLGQSDSLAQDQERKPFLHIAIDEFHEAFRNSDAERMKKLVADEMSLVTAGGVSRSATEFLDGTRALLAERPDLTMNLTADSVELGPSSWGIAAEQGTWVEEWTQADVQVVLKGQYQAMWRHVDGSWRLSGLMLVPTECAGPYCE